MLELRGQWRGGIRRTLNIGPQVPSTVCVRHTLIGLELPQVGKITGPQAVRTQLSLPHLMITEEHLRSADRSTAAKAVMSGHVGQWALFSDSVFREHLHLRVDADKVTIKSGQCLSEQAKHPQPAMAQCPAS